MYPDLLKSSVKYYALDLVQSNLDEIKQSNKNENLECILADLDGFDWQDNYFDMIICSGSIEYTFKPKDNLLKLIRFLKEDGVLICSFPNAANPYRIWHKYIYKYVSFTKKRILNEVAPFYARKLFLLKKLELILNNTNLSSVKIRYFGYKFIPQPFDDLLNNIDYKIIKYLQSHPQKCLQKYCTEFLLILKK